MSALTNPLEWDEQDPEPDEFPYEDALRGGTKVTVIIHVHSQLRAALDTVLSDGFDTKQYLFKVIASAEEFIDEKQVDELLRLRAKAVRVSGVAALCEVDRQVKCDTAGLLRYERSCLRGVKSEYVKAAILYLERYRGSETRYLKTVPQRQDKQCDDK